MNAENNKTKGFICGAIAAATYGMNPLFTLPLYSEGMNCRLGIILPLCTAGNHSRHYNET